MIIQRIARLNIRLDKRLNMRCKQSFFSMLMNKNLFIIRHRFSWWVSMPVWRMCGKAGETGCRSAEKGEEKDDSAKNKKELPRSLSTKGNGWICFMPMRRRPISCCDRMFRCSIGSVKLRHDSMYMYCDSAPFIEKQIRWKLFSNVRMEQGDTLFIYGDYLNYKWRNSVNMLRENVKLINRKTILTTDSLNYDRLYPNLGYYFEGGTLTDEENILTSDWGIQSGKPK